MNILLTGGAGYIGSHVLLSIIENGHKVTVIDDISTGTESLIPKNINHIKCNINDEKKFLIFSKMKPLIFFCILLGLLKLKSQFNILINILKIILITPLSFLKHATKII